ncbi:methyltransferase [Sphingorhabdus lutea]|uniref:Methyltransferase n=1 Tax=Sphingorhabdus lutea TaxID=1913578 RepID=A0A1L3JCM8_9SPHN|nr:class I SAM-dependent methyltransferase [Sphingorhabdus lutea]APG62872.1 methyltransferase [Sphingorhabdus lutea]
MKKSLTLSAALLAASAFVAPAMAEHHGDKEAVHEQLESPLDPILASDIRKDDMARDKYRHPKDTLVFFDIRPDMKVGEYAPGGGWYSRILGPLLAEKGQYVGLFFNPDNLPFSDEAKERTRAGAAKFPEDVAKWTGISADKFPTYTMDKVPAEAKGTMDRILIIRMMHNMLRWNMADSEIAAMRDLLKDDGMIGIVQHRAKADASYALSDGNKGYLREADVIKFMEVHGFELVNSSEVNANDKDTADYENGVWTLPPAFAKKDVDKEKYEAIGESDRMTLLFKKRP